MKKTVLAFLAALAISGCTSPTAMANEQGDLITTGLIIVGLGLTIENMLERERNMDVTY